MDLENRFSVPVPVDQAWQVLLDVERIAPCMPGATLTGQEGDTFSGTVKVKVGPINLTYGGTMTFVSRDEQARIVVLQGRGKETRGTGTAQAMVTCRLIDQGATTDVEVDTDLRVTGKPASFGRGVLADVSGKLVDQFAACLAEEIRTGSPQQVAAVAQFVVDLSAGPDGDPPSPPVVAAPSVTDAPAAPSVSDAPPAPPTVRRPVREAEPIDLLGTVGAPVLRRVAPTAAALVVGLLLGRWLGRRR